MSRKIATILGLATLLTLFVFIYSCSKKNDAAAASKTPGEILADELKADSTNNCNVLSGTGSMVYEQALVASTPSQVISTVDYNQDTVGFFGKINTTSQLQYVHTMVINKKGGAKQIVTEAFPDVSKIRTYNIVNNVKSRFVIETQYLNSTDFMVSILDYNWTTNTSTSLSSIYYSNGVKISAGINNRKVIMTDPSGAPGLYNTQPPAPTDNLESNLDKVLAWFASLQAVPGVAFITDLGTAANNVAKLPAYQSNAPDLSQVVTDVNASNAESSSLSAIWQKLTGVKTSIKKQSFKKFQSFWQETFPKGVEVALSTDLSKSVINYDEVVDANGVLAAQAVIKGTTTPYTTQPMYVDFNLVVPGTTTSVFKITLATLAIDGTIKLLFNPLTIANISQYPQLEMQYGFTQDKGSALQKQTFTFAFVKPKALFSDGSAIPATIPFLQNETKKFELVNNDGRAFNFDYTAITFANSTNSKVILATTNTTSGFSIKSSTADASTQTTTVDLLYKGVKFQTLTIQAATSECSQGLINAPVITGIEIKPGIWTPNAIAAFVSFTANGSGILWSSSYSGSANLNDPLAQTYPVRLLFEQSGISTYSLAANSYTVRLYSGTVNQGIVEIDFLHSVIPGQTARQSLDAYYTGYKWEVQLMNICNQRSGLFSF
jgi:hypothetical protein